MRKDRFACLFSFAQQKKPPLREAFFLCLFSVFHGVHDPEEDHGADDGDDQAVKVKARYLAHVKDVAGDKAADKGSDDPGDDVCHGTHGFVFAHNFTCDPSGQCAED